MQTLIEHAIEIAKNPPSKSKVIQFEEQYCQLIWALKLLGHEVEKNNARTN